jgi:phosphohistidine phosphatase
MKYVFYTRHGKSSWDDPFLEDHDRPLKKRGVKDAGIITDRLQHFEIKPNIIFTSSAKRAAQTAEIFKKNLEIPYIQYFIDLYHASDRAVLEFLNNLEVDYQGVMIFGHNPGFTDLINRYSDRYFYNVPTTGTFCIQYSCNNWNEISEAEARLIEYWFPKDFK